MIEFKSINPNENGLSVRAKINNMLSALISGKEGVNNLWTSLTSLTNTTKNIQTNVTNVYNELKDQVLKSFDYTDSTASELRTYINGMSGGVSGFAEDTSFKPTYPFDTAATVIGVGPGTFTNMRDSSGSPITISDVSIVIFFKGANSNYWKYNTILPTVIKNEITEEFGSSTEKVINQKFFTKSVTEYNVSVQHPTQGIDGSNKYTLETAIALVPTECRSIGIKCAFINENGQEETWEYLKDDWKVDNFFEVGAKKNLFLSGDNITNIINIISVKTNVYVDSDGNEQYSTQNNRMLYEIDLSRIPEDTMLNVKYKSLGSSAYGITLYNSDGTKLFHGKPGNSSIVQESFSVIKDAVTMKLNFDSTFKPYIVSNAWDNAKEIKKIDSQIKDVVDYSLLIENTGEMTKIYNVGATADSVRTPFANYGTLKISCKKGDKFYLYLQGGNTALAYGFVDDNNKVLQCSGSGELIRGEFTAPEKTKYLILNNAFSGSASLPNPTAIKYGIQTKLDDVYKELTDEINELYNTIADVANLEITANEVLDGKYINTSGIIANTASANRRVNKYSLKNNVTYLVHYSEGNSATIAYCLKSLDGDILKLGPVGANEGEKREFTLMPEQDCILELFTTDINNIGVNTLSKTDEKIQNLTETVLEIDKKSTNTAGFYLPNNSILISGASICEPINGCFEYAMSVLGVTFKNISIAGTNIFQLGYELYTNGINYAKTYDLLIMSHTHNYDVYNVPEKIKNMTVEEIEQDGEIGTHFTTADFVNGTPAPTSSYTTEELYAIGYDYVIKKWISLNYNLKSEDTYNTFYGKPAQICLYTYWHDARTVYNTAIRKLAKKWNLLLVKDDENIGFSKDTVHPITQKQYSILYTNSSKWQKTEFIDGVEYGFHPDTVSEDNMSIYNSTKKMLLEYLPYIQKRRAAILIKTLKNAILK